MKSIHRIDVSVERIGRNIGIDTGAFMSGRLTALAITGARIRLITAVGAVDRPYAAYADL